MCKTSMAALMMRMFAWWGMYRSMSPGVIPPCRSTSWMVSHRIATAQRQVARAGEAVGVGGHQRVHEAGAGRLDLDGGAGQFQPVLHQAGRRGERHVRRERGEYEQVDVPGVDAGAVDAAAGRLVAQVA